MKAVARVGTMSGMHLDFVTLAERPDLMAVFWDLETSWPEFMKHDPIGNGYYASLEEFADYVVVCLDAEGRMVAKAHSVPFVLDDDELPDASRGRPSPRARSARPRACSHWRWCPR